MRPSNNLRLRNQQNPPNAPRIPCPHPRCTSTFRSSTTLTLHVRRAIHTIPETVEQTTSSPTTSNQQSNLRASSSPPPVHNTAPLFAELGEEDASPLPSHHSSSDTSTPSSNSSNSSSPKGPPGSPIAIDRDLPSGSAHSTPSSSQSGMQVDDFDEQLASFMSGILHEHVPLFEDDASQPDADNDQHGLDARQQDDAGVPITRIYHPHLNGKFCNDSLIT